MRFALIAGLALVSACTGLPSAPDVFAGQAGFAAQRERETVVIEAMDVEEACAHVAAVLMDLDCSLEETNVALGVISARPGTEAPPVPTLLLRREVSCGGRDATVTVDGDQGGRLKIRASFSPPTPDADDAFRTLLRRSLDTGL